METKIINGKKTRDELLVKIKKEVEKLPFVPVFCDILVGEDLVSHQYVQIKKRMAQESGVLFKDANFKADIKTEELLAEINKLNNLENICGIIVQLPLPNGLDTRKILDAINPKLDVDCLGSVNSQNFYKNEYKIGFPTALACKYILDSLNLDLLKNRKKIVVLGQGELVGKPVTALLRFNDISVMPIDSRTEDKEKLIKEADIIISGMGNGKYITGDMIKEGVILIDAGTSEEGSGIVGDVDLESVKGKASFVSPVPGGVGPVTVAILLENILKVAQKRNE